jgi:outer membrane receptor protein involved in Fe transport
MLFHVLAQVAVAAAPQPAAPQQGVISYPPSFFAAFQPANAAEMILRVPGFVLDGGAAVRGYEGSAGNVLIDGERPSTKSEDLEQVLRRIPASRIERIDLIRGGAPGIDMQGKAVLANIVRKPGGGFRGVAAVSENHTWDGRVATSARLEGSGDLGPRRWELGVLTGKFIDDGYGNGHGVHIDAIGLQTPLDVVSEGDGLNGQVTGVFETPILGGKVRLNGRIFSEKYKAEDNSIFADPALGREDNVDHTRTDDTELGGTFTRKFGDKTTLEIVGLRQTHDQDINSDFTDGSSSSFALTRDGSETIGRAVLKYRFNERVSLEGGAETAINKLDSATRLTQDGAPIELPAADVGVEEDRSEAFVKGTWRPTGQWTLDASIRFEHSEISSSGDVTLSKTLEYWKPRFAATWAPSESTQVRLRVEHEVGQLDFDDFVATAGLNTNGVTAGNPDLNPEQDWVYEAAIEERFWRDGSLTVTFRHFEIKDVIDRGPVRQETKDPVTGETTVKFFDRPENIGDGTKDELALEWSVPLARLGLDGATFRGNLTKRWTSVEDPTTHEDREISALKPLEWEATYIQDLPRWKITYGVDAFGGWRRTYYRFNQIDTTKLRTFVRPFAEWRPRPDINVRFELPNVTARGLKRTIHTWPGPRSAGGAPVLDDRDYSPRQMFYVRVRKTLGG